MRLEPAIAPSPPLREAPPPIAGPRPLRLLPQPEPITVIAEVPDAPPSRDDLASRLLPLRQGLRPRAPRCGVAEHVACAWPLPSRRWKPPLARVQLSSIDRGSPDPGLLHRRGRERPPLLAVPARTLRHRARATLVSARVLRMTQSPPVHSNDNSTPDRPAPPGLCRAGLHLQFLVSARWLASRGTGDHLLRARAQGIWPHRPQQLCRRRPRLCRPARHGPAASKGLPLPRRHAPLLC